MRPRIGTGLRLVHARWRLPALALGGLLAAAVVAFTYARADARAPIDGQAIPVGASSTNSSEPDIFDTLAVISERALSDMRGGFSLAGLEMDFGANVRTLIDGTLALETVVKLTDSGLVSRQITPPTESVPDVPGLTLVFGDGSGPTIEDVTPPDVDLSALAEASGVVLNDSKGFTAALHQITRDQILSVLVSTATGRAIRQELDIDVTVANFKHFQQTVRSALLANRLATATRR